MSTNCFTKEELTALMNAGYVIVSIKSGLYCMQNASGTNMFYAGGHSSLHRSFAVNSDKSEFIVKSKYRFLLEREVYG